MKNQFSFRVKMVAVCLAVLTMLGTMSGCDDDDEMDNRPYTISGDGDGAQMVPAVGGSGTGSISGTYDPSTRELTYTSNWNGLSGAPSSAGFYRGASGASGTVVGTPWTFQTGATGTGSINGTMTLTNEQASDMLGGNWYYSYGTTANPDGEVRGQISARR
jgi:hypothetical protein